MSVLTKSGQNQACKMQFQSVVCSVVQVWVQVWPYGTTSGEASTHFFPFCDFHLATTLFSFFLFFLALKVHCTMENVFIYIN